MAEDILVLICSGLMIVGGIGFLIVAQAVSR